MLLGWWYYHYANSMCHACEKQGHEVKKLVIPEFKEITSYWVKMATKIGVSSIKENFFQKMNTEFIEEVNNFKPDVCIVMNGKGINHEFLSFLKSKKILSILYMSDSIQCSGFAQYLSNLPLYSRIFSYEPSDTLLYDKIKYLFLGYDEDIFCPKPGFQKDIDISFVGMLDNNRMKLLEKVAELAVKNNKTMLVRTNPLFPRRHIFHDVRNFQRKRKLMEQYPFLNQVMIDVPVYNQDLADIYRKSKICINIHRGPQQQRHSGMNPRTLEILGCQAFQLVDQGHLGKVQLKPGKHLVEFSSVSDLCEKLKYYLENEIERLTIANSGYQMAKERYSMSACMKHMLAGTDYFSHNSEQSISLS